MNAVLPTPSERLAHSRAQLLQALRDGAPGAPGRPATDHGRDGWRAHPGIAFVAGVIGPWWSRHPLRVSATLAAQAATVAVRPLAQRHPLGVLAGAFVFGAVLAWTRPWRWPKAALLTGVLPQLLLAAFRANPAPRPDPRQAP